MNKEVAMTVPGQKASRRRWRCYRRECFALQERLENLLGSEIADEVFQGMYVKGRVIGAGTLSEVYEAVDRVTKMKVALKLIPKKNLILERCSVSFSPTTKLSPRSSERAVVRVRRRLVRLADELEILRQLSHPNIIPFIRAIETRSSFCIVTALVSGSTVREMLSNLRLNITEDLSRTIFRQLASAVAYLHKRRIYHWDIKPENVLVDRQCRVFLIDFGFSEREGHRHEDDPARGTIFYSPPELLSRRLRGPNGLEGDKIDVWSLGIVLCELLSHRSLCVYSYKSSSDLKDKILKGSYRVAQGVSDEGRRLIDRMLRTRPDDRATVEEVLQDPWLQHQETTQNDDWKENQKGATNTCDEQGRDKGKSMREQLCSDLQMEEDPADCC